MEIEQRGYENETHCSCGKDVPKLIAEIRRLQCDVREITAREFAQRALANAHISINNYLQKQISDAPFVYGIGQPGEPYDSDKDYWWRTRSGEDTHCARLVEIKKIGEGE